MLNDASAHVSSINTTSLELLLNQDRPTTIFLLVFSKSSDSQWQQHLFRPKPWYLGESLKLK